MDNSKEVQKKYYNRHFAKDNNWNDVCFESGSKYFIERFIDSAIRPEAKKVLEIGCGNGLLTFFLLKRSVNITAIDISGRAIENMRHQFAGEIREGLLELKCADVIEFLKSTDEKYDAIIGSGIIHHIKKEDWKNLFQSARRGLVPGGIFACGPEPNAGGLYALAWPFARIFYKLFGMEYNWEVEKGTIDMISSDLKAALKESGFQAPEILPFQCIPHFHIKMLEYIDKKLIKHFRGRISLYIIVRGKK